MMRNDAKMKPFRGSLYVSLYIYKGENALTGGGGYGGAGYGAPQGGYNQGNYYGGGYGQQGAYGQHGGYPQQVRVIDADKFARM